MDGAFKIIFLNKPEKVQKWTPMLELLIYKYAFWVLVGICVQFL